MQVIALNKRGIVIVVHNYSEGKADTANYSKSKSSHYIHTQRHRGGFRKYQMIGVMRKTMDGGGIRDR